MPCICGEWILPVWGELFFCARRGRAADKQTKIKEQDMSKLLQREHMQIWQSMQFQAREVVEYRQMEVSKNIKIVSRINYYEPLEKKIFLPFGLQMKESSSVIFCFVNNFFYFQCGRAFSLLLFFYNMVWLGFCFFHFLAHFCYYLCQLLIYCILCTVFKLF